MKWYSVRNVIIIDKERQIMLLLPGLVQGAQPLLSYNPGARNISRVI